MKKNIIASTKFPVSGPYSAAVEANDFIFISGQLPVDPATGEMINDIEKATRQVLTNIKMILNKTDLDMSNIVKTTVFLKNITDFPAVNEIYARFFPEEPPARSTIEASVLPKGALIEIEAIAIRK
ncbi:MAG: reactive intermediate/imine deaminase [Deltaproteobacteria bacterium HGW-Deltaproteobacteria-13]|jgi:2-iminobutanoate/2-iminopropanoate deaminase|nr:MAG: reactive intermediate/imine deaminase [Deltaproteobacteria bacterium HGW-Deltaproteobacteria-13]